jgi:hypothetical protein
VLFSNQECAMGIEFISERGAFCTHLEKIDCGKIAKLPIGVQAWEQTAEEKHSEVGGDGSELPPC